jgi:hypothetical protein
VGKENLLNLCDAINSVLTETMGAGNSQINFVIIRQAFNFIENVELK